MSPYSPSLFSRWWHAWLCRYGLVQVYPWGRSVAELTLDFDQPQRRGLIKASSGIHRIAVRPCLGADHWQLDRLRRENRAWLAHWESTLPPNSAEWLPNLREYAQRQDYEMLERRSLNMLIEVNGEIAGSVSVGSVQHGAMSVGTLGYWIAEKWANQGVTTLAVAAVIDLALTELQLHRIEVVVRPENKPSLSLCRKLHLHEEGLRQRYMHIAGAWCDHVAFVADQEMLAARGCSYVERIG